MYGSRQSFLVLAFHVLLATTLGTAGGAQQRLGSEFRVNEWIDRNQEHASVASSSVGDFVVVWTSLDQDGSRRGVFARRYDPSGNPLGEESQVNSYTTGHQQYPDIAADAEGNFVVVWDSYYQDGDGFGVFGQRYDATGTPLGDEFPVNTYTTGYQRNASVALSSSGDFVVAWESADQDGDDEGVFGQRFDAAGNPVGGEFRVNSYTSYWQEEPTVAADVAGNMVVVWNSFRQDGSGDGIFGRRFDASGIPVGGEFLVNSYTFSNQESPSVAMDPDGDFVVTWQSWHDGNDFGIFGQRYDIAGTPQGGEFQINTFTSWRQINPDVAMDASGSFVVVWQSLHQDGSEVGVFGQRFDDSGQEVGSEFQANTYTTGLQHYPAVSADADGDFVVVWHSYRFGVLRDDVFGQRYAGDGLRLSVEGPCPGPVTVTVLQGPVSSEVAVIGAANTNGFVKGGAICAGTAFEIGEPLQLPPTFVVVDANGKGSKMIDLQPGRCHLQALALATCETSNVVRVPQVAQ